MERGTRTRILALALVLAPVLGCGGEGGGSSGGLFISSNLPAVQSFLDDFSGDFPGGNWIIKEGNPAVDPDQGNPSPGLAMQAGDRDDRVRGAFVFSTAGPLTASVDLGIPGFMAGQPGRAGVEIEADSDGPEASFEIRLEDGVIEFEILGAETDVAFAGDADFHTLTFDIAADQTATWSMDGTIVMTVPDFPVVLAQIDLRAHNPSPAVFVFDNVSIEAQEAAADDRNPDDAPPVAVEEFSDDFAGDFPGDAWIVEDGAPAIDGDRGNPAPSLALGPANDNIKVRSAFTFSSADPLTLSFDLATPDLPTDPSDRFRFELERDSMGGCEASLEIRLEDGRIRLEILGSQAEIAFSPDADFHAISFSVDADGVAAWSIDGEVVLMRSSFPQGLFRIEAEAHGGGNTGFLLDNVDLARP